MGLININKVKPKPKDKQISKFNESRVLLRIYSTMGGLIRTKKVEVEATEERNGFGELVAKNDNAGIEENIDFLEDTVFKNLKVLLDLRNKDPEQVKDILTKAIKKQERIIYYLDKLEKANAFYNYQDEWGKLINLRVMRNHLKLDKKGSFFKIENGYI